MNNMHSRLNLVLHVACYPILCYLTVYGERNRQSPRRRTGPQPPHESTPRYKGSRGRDVGIRTIAMAIITLISLPYGSQNHLTSSGLCMLGVEDIVAYEESNFPVVIC